MKINKIETYGWEAAIRGMRNPMNSWFKTDSWFKDYDGYHTINGNVFYGVPDHNDEVFIGPKDLELAKNLVKAGTDHSKFMRMIIFSCDIEAPLYWWKEMDTYKVGTVRNSCSTMHKIMDKKFEETDFSTEHNYPLFSDVLEFLNDARETYLDKETTTEEKEDIFKLVIELLPSSYVQKSTWMANYQVLRNIYHSRKCHRLNEWRFFCKVIEGLPYSEFITME